MSNNQEVTLKDFLELTNFRITDVNTYCWGCFGEDILSVEYWNGSHTGFSMNCLYSKKTFQVFSIEICNYRNNAAFRWVDPAYAEAEIAESNRRGVNSSVAWSDEDSDGNPVEIIWQDKSLEEIRQIAAFLLLGLLR